MTVKCPNCGMLIEMDYGFCVYCGLTLIPKKSVETTKIQPAIVKSPILIKLVAFWELVSWINISILCFMFISYLFNCFSITAIVIGLIPALGVILIGYLLANGLWKMRIWARDLIVAKYIIFTAIAIVGALSEPSLGFLAISCLVPIILLVVYWARFI